jgi:hypothetical protein
MYSGQWQNGSDVVEKSWNTHVHDENSDMLLAHGGCSAGRREHALPYPGRQHSEVNVFRQWRIVSVSQEMLHPRTVETLATEDDKIAAVVRERWSSRYVARELGLLQPREV